MRTIKGLLAFAVVMMLAAACTENDVQPQKQSAPRMEELPPKNPCTGGGNCG